MNPTAATPSKVPSLIAKPPTGRAKPAKLEPLPPVRFYVVESETMRIKVQHGDFQLRKGKEIKSTDYDIKLLRNRGVRLREVSTPGWYIDAQVQGRAKAQQLKDAGHDVEVPDEYEPIVIAEPAPAA